MYLLDTCICIDFLRGKVPYAYELMRKSDPRLFKIPAIVEAELRVGAEKSKDPKKTLRYVDEFLLAFEILPFDSLCAQHYGKLRAKLEQKGNVIGSNDLLIAATALAKGAILVTNNVEKFKRIENLSLESWYEMKWEDQ